MKFPHHLLHMVLALSLALVGCGDGGKTGKGDSWKQSVAAPKQAEVANDLASLIPSNAAAIVYVKSPAKLESGIRSVVGKFDPEAASEIEISSMVGSMLMGQVTHWDMTKPMAVAVALPAEGADIGDAMQGMSMIFGMKDAAAAKKAMDERLAQQFEGAPPEALKDKPTITVAGNYLTISAGSSALGGSKIAATAPDGDLGIRIDLAALVARYRKDIDAGMGEMQEGMDKSMGDMPPGMAQFGDMFKGLASTLKDFVNSAETLDIGISVEGSEVDLAIGFVAKAGSKLDVQSHDHSGLTAMAGLLPEGMPVNLLMSLDMGSLLEWLKPLMKTVVDSMPEDQKKGFQAYMDETTEMSKLLGPNIALAMGFGENGMEMVEVLDCRDGATYIQRVDKLMASNTLAAIPGLGAAKSGTTTVAGVEVHSYSVTMDLAKMMAAQGQDVPEEASAKFGEMMKAFFGGESMTFHMASLDNKILFTMGSEAGLAQAIETARSGGKAPSALQKAIDRAGGKPTFILQVDVRKIASQVTGLMKRVMGDDMAGEKMPAIPAGKPIPVLVWGKHDGRVYGGGLRVDVGGIADMVEEMKGN